MKRYYVSRIDHTEVINVTTDPEQLQKARQRLVDLEMLDSDGTVHGGALPSRRVLRLVPVYGIPVRSFGMACAGKSISATGHSGCFSDLLYTYDSEFPCIFDLPSRKQEGSD